MTTAGSDAARVLAGHYAAVVESLTPDEWERPSRCAGWSVRNLVAHTGSNFKVIVDPPQGEADPDLKAEDMQELLVRERAEWSAQAVAEEFLTFRDPALGVFAAIQDEPTASAPLTLSELGTYDMHLLADAFAFDMWCHLYVDLLAPEGPVERDLEGRTDDLLGPAVGWMLAGIPQMCLPVGAVLDRPFGLALTGPGGGEWTLAPGDPFPVLSVGVDKAAAVVTSPTSDFVLWGTKRTDWRPSSTLSGDEAYATAVLDAMNIV